MRASAAPAARPSSPRLLAAACLLVLFLSATHWGGTGGHVITSAWSVKVRVEQLPAAAPPALQCSLDVEATSWAKHCQHLQRVCLDQSTIVLYGDEYQELDGKPAGPLPKLEVAGSRIFRWPWRGREADFRAAAAAASGGEGSNGGGSGGSSKGGDGAAAGQEVQQQGVQGERQVRRLTYEVQADYHRQLKPPNMRPATADEPTPYLRLPSFSNCTVPVVVAATWRRNFVHVILDSAFWFAMARRTPFRDHLKFLALTPDGLALSGPEAQMLSALSPLGVQSLADASARLPPGHGPGSVFPRKPGAPPASYEGGEQRCFQHLFFCAAGAGNRPPRKPAPLNDYALAEGAPKEMFAWGQALAEHVRRQQEASRQRQQQQGQSGWQLQRQQGLAGWRQEQQDQPQLPAVPGQGVSLLRGSGSRRLRVIFVKRDLGSRQLLNADELLERCNAWRLQLPGGKGTVTAECRQVTTPNLAAGAAAAREADILVSVHGANMGNSWLMRPGSSTVEIINRGYAATIPGVLSFSGFSAMDPTSQLQWWVLMICDPALSTPGAEEVQKTGSERLWPRDRNVRLPWPALEAAFAAAVEAGGNQQRYLKRWYDKGRYRFNVGPDGVMSQGRDQERCPTLS